MLFRVVRAAAIRHRADALPNAHLSNAWVISGRASFVEISPVMITVVDPARYLDRKNSSKYFRDKALTLSVLPSSGFEYRDSWVYRNSENFSSASPRGSVSS